MIACFRARSDMNDKQTINIAVAIVVKRSEVHSGVPRGNNSFASQLGGTLPLRPSRTITVVIPILACRIESNNRSVDCEGTI